MSHDIEFDSAVLEQILSREATKVAVGQPTIVSPKLQQVGGSHYMDMKIQPMEFSMANDLNACQHTAIKYIVRRKGNRLQDIDKAIHTLYIYREMIANGEAE
jgi:hypothetical protein